MIDPKLVHETLARHQLADGYPFVLDLDKSHGSWLHDARTDTQFLDFFTNFASWPIGWNHPRMSEPAFLAEMQKAATNNPANSDLYTQLQAEFVQEFATRVTPASHPHHFWISGGALAVENAMKAAFDWKAHKANVQDDGASLVVLHFKHAFHGRSGYTLSVTNTKADKIALFPKFTWPRVHSPAIEFDLQGKIANDVAAEEAKSCREIEAAFAQYKNRIACILIEPMQSEGGDNHFRTEFLRKLRQYADENAALLVFDEVQTGFFGSGKPWLWQHHDVEPDIVAFGKKTQICGIYSNRRIDEVEDNVFRKVSRINSTWGGSLTDMVRSKQFIRIILDEKMPENVTRMGAQLIAGLRALASERGEITNVRGLGSLIAFTLKDGATRDEWLKKLREKKLLALASGERAIRFRLPFVVQKAEIDVALEKVAACLPSRVRA